MATVYNYLLELITSVLSVVVSQATYEVEEVEGFVTVCVTLSEGPLDRDVSVLVSTEDITAQGRERDKSLNSSPIKNV